MTAKQRDILDYIATWAANYPCIRVMHVYGSIARGEEKPTSDIDIAFEYVANIATEATMVTCYTKVNDDWESLAYSLQDRFGHLGRVTGLSPYNAPYDHKAWAAIREGREIGRSGKVKLTWTAPKPAAKVCKWSPSQTE
jgi:predicted nucleotidyltransferase